MTPSKHRILRLSLLICMSFGATHVAHAEIIERVAARVNSEIITLYDIEQAATPYMLQRGVRPEALNDPTKRPEILKDVLGDLIESKLLVQEAKKLNLSVTDAELNQWIAYTRRQQGLSEEQFKQTIGRYGMTYLEYKEMTRKNLLRVRLTRIKVGAKARVSDAEVEAQYRARYGQSGGTDRYISLRHILIQPASTEEPDVRAAYKRAVAARARLVSGEEFGLVAETASDGPSAKNKGVLGTFTKGDLDPQVEAASFDLETMKISDIVRTKYGFHIFQVFKTEERPNPNIAERMDEIRGQLQQKANERQLKSYLQALKTKAFVRVNL